jgi:ABC-type glycerol-3-phosphate transport system substrate-binding protein
MYNAVNKMALGQEDADQAYDEMNTALEGLLAE